MAVAHKLRGTMMVLPEIALRLTRLLPDHGIV